MDVSIIIVNYNTKDLTKQTIQAVIETTNKAKYEIILVDNASRDGTVEAVQEEYPNIKVIVNTENLGFSKANNIGMRQSIGKYVLLLNSDTKVLCNCIDKCFAYMEQHKDICTLGPKINLENGDFDHACKRGFPTPASSFYYMLKFDKFFPGNKKYGRYKMNYLSVDEVNEVDSLTGAFMMVRKEVIDKIGDLDEEFFMYGEDLDWCYRIKEAGYKVMYYPEAKMIHYKGQSSKKKRTKTIYEFHRAMYLFYNKHYYKKYNLFITLFVYVGIGIKLPLSYIANIFKIKN
ncbi:glycosyltransferase family 2 protein [Clostridium tagluense]|uniref:glycosyltransferase family 2 protein n=1 Tax=Clostridium tagluense TaxID=360422 RepID=UPI001C6ECBC4|nr:glycosyltransferase family 2 protein [Clostridium tagluense]MBW9156997.1 glycosyltransferase family 2 protein [Clostridium tagluense]WLC64984.1 glycosyltransferase family 2 protein [Clostridium tagluense]